MIYINFVEFHCLILHARFQNRRPLALIGPVVSEKIFEIVDDGRTTVHGYTISSTGEPLAQVS